MKTILVVFILMANLAKAQTNTVGHFSFWKPKQGKEEDFNAGYKKHLEWHKINGDKKNWYGWYFITGPRTDFFLDATLNHNWSEFDKPLKSSEDNTDVNLHVAPFGDYQYAQKMVYLPSLSNADSNSMRLKYLRMITILVTNVDSAKLVVEKFLTLNKSKGIKHFSTYKMVDGDNMNQLIIFLGVNNFEEFGKFEDFQENILKAETSLKIKTIISAKSETLVYVPDMSLFPK